jgi:hypothetical protein
MWINGALPSMSADPRVSPRFVPANSTIDVGAASIVFALQHGVACGHATTAMKHDDGAFVGAVRAVLPIAREREVMLWVDGNNLPNESMAAWEVFMQNFTRFMRPAITSVAVCPYTVTSNGTFGYQDITQPLCHGPPPGPEGYTGEIQERLAIPLFKKTGVKQCLLRGIVLCSLDCSLCHSNPSICPCSIWSLMYNYIRMYDVIQCALPYIYIYYSNAFLGAGTLC